MDAPNLSFSKGSHWKLGLFQATMKEATMGWQDPNNDGKQISQHLCNINQQIQSASHGESAEGGAVINKFSQKIHFCSLSLSTLQLTAISCLKQLNVYLACLGCGEWLSSNPKLDQEKKIGGTIISQKEDGIFRDCTLQQDGYWNSQGSVAAAAQWLNFAYSWLREHSEMVEGILY